MKNLFGVIIMLALFAQGEIAVTADNSKQETRQIQWLTSLDKALAKAKSENKPVFLDFFNPN